eukprot:GFYU01018790.1.p1 GENE.GFYU01018790.1~~GFYU01018790.1.p1  ORF type:complete len:596 (-),score=122.95 GFYU01018790.1:203-1990(-)
MRKTMRPYRWCPGATVAVCLAVASLCGVVLAQRYIPTSGGSCQTDADCSRNGVCRRQIQDGIAVGTCDCLGPQVGNGGRKVSNGYTGAVCDQTCPDDATWPKCIIDDGVTNEDIADRQPLKVSQNSQQKEETPVTFLVWGAVGMGSLVGCVGIVCLAERRLRRSKQNSASKGKRSKGGRGSRIAPLDELKADLENGEDGKKRGTFLVAPPSVGNAPKSRMEYDKNAIHTNSFSQNANQNSNAHERRGSIAMPILENSPLEDNRTEEGFGEAFVDPAQAVDELEALASQRDNAMASHRSNAMASHRSNALPSHRSNALPSGRSDQPSARTLGSAARNIVSSLSSARQRNNKSTGDLPITEQSPLVPHGGAGRSHVDLMQLGSPDSQGPNAQPPQLFPAQATSPMSTLNTTQSPTATTASPGSQTLNTSGYSMDPHSPQNQNHQMLDVPGATPPADGLSDFERQQKAIQERQAQIQQQIQLLQQQRAMQQQQQQGGGQPMMRPNFPQQAGPRPGGPLMPQAMGVNPASRLPAMPKPGAAAVRPPQQQQNPPASSRTQQMNPRPKKSAQQTFMTQLNAANAMQRSNSPYTHEDEGSFY